MLKAKAQEASFALLLLTYSNRIDSLSGTFRSTQVKVKIMRVRGDLLEYFQIIGHR